jgi:hypothetical protein
MHLHKLSIFLIIIQVHHVLKCVKFIEKLKFISLRN